MTAVTSFTVFHKNPEVRESLGRGFVVGTLQEITKYQFQGVLPNTKTAALITQSKVVLKYQVLWENQRHISPSLHNATDLEWEMLTDEYLAAMADEELEGEIQTATDGVNVNEEDNLLNASEEFQDAPMDNVLGFNNDDTQTSPTV